MIDTTAHLTLEEAQDIVEDHAPRPYYAETYRAWEGQYLPEVCERLDDLRPGRVLDIGPGWGALAVWLRSRNWDVWLMDVVPLGTFIARDLLDEIQATYVHRDICRAPARDVGTQKPVPFGLVVCGQVLTHLKWSARAAMSNIRAMVKGQGQLLLTVSDSATYDYRRDDIAYADWRGVPMPTAGVTPPANETICTYDETDLRELLSQFFDFVQIEKPADCLSLIATCKP